MAGDRQGSEARTRQTADGVLRGKVPQVRGRDAPSRSPVWAPLAQTSAPLQALLVEMVGGGRSQRDMAAALEQALGHFVLSKSALSPLPDTLSQAYAALRPRDLRSSAVASRFLDTVYDPLRRWGSKTGGRCVWGICGDGCQVFLTLSAAKSESCERCRAVLRDLTMWGLQTPGTITPDGASGRIKAVDVVGPRSLRMREKRSGCPAACGGGE
jgi:transposase-like protein